MSEKLLELRLHDGKSLKVRHRAGKGAPRQAVVAVHGMISHSGWFSSLGEALSDQGFAFYAADRRGSGIARHLPLPSDADVLFRDVETLINRARAEADQVFLFLWCWGAKLCLPIVRDLQVDGLVLAAPGLYIPKPIIDKFRGFTPTDGTLAVPFNALTDFSERPEVRAWIARDSLKLERVPEHFRDVNAKLSPLAIAAVPGLRLPRIAFLAEGDILIDNPPTAQALKDFPIKTFEGGHGIVLERPRELVQAMRPVFQARGEGSKAA